MTPEQASEIIKLLNSIDGGVAVTFYAICFLIGVSIVAGVKK